MHEWEVKVNASKEKNSLECESWVEKVKALDKINARNQALSQAMIKKPEYQLYDISTIIEVKA